MNFCNCSGTIYTSIGTTIPFKIENVKSSEAIRLIEGIKDFYAHKTKFDAMCITLGTVVADLTQTIAVDFEVVEEFEGDKNNEN